MNVEKGKISGMQLFFCVTGFVQGSIFLVNFAVGITESQTWMAVLASIAISIPFVYSYIALAKRFPGLNIIQINDVVYGPIIGKLLSLYYILFFALTLSFNIRDIGELYNTFLMPDAPFIFFLVVFAATCAYAVYKGLESIARISHVVVTISIAITILIFLLLIDYMDFSNFLPFFKVPPIKILHGLHVISAIPFAESIIFLMIICSVKKKDKVAKNYILGILVGGMVLLNAAIRNTAVLGKTETLWTSASFESARIIDLGTVLTRMDLLIGVTQTIMIFFKTCLFLYAFVTAVAQILGLKSYLPILLPLTAIEVILAATVFQSPVDHAMITQNAGIIYSTPLLYLIPAISLLIAVIRGLPKTKRRKKS